MKITAGIFLLAALIGVGCNIAQYRAYSKLWHDNAQCDVGF